MVTQSQCILYGRIIPLKCPTHESEQYCTYLVCKQGGSAVMQVANKKCTTSTYRVSSMTGDPENTSRGFRMKEKTVPVHEKGTGNKSYVYKS